MISNLKPEDLNKKQVRNDKNFDSADAALDSIGERLAEKSLMAQQMQGKSVDQVVKDLDLNMNKDEQKEIYKKFFNEKDEEVVTGPSEAEILAQKEAEEKEKQEE